MVLRIFYVLGGMSSLVMPAKARSAGLAAEVALQKLDLLRDTLIPNLAVLRQLSTHMRLCLQMNLLDRAIKLAAEQDEPEEMNFVRKHARQQVRQRPCDFMSKAVPALTSSWQAPAAECFAPPVHLHRTCTAPARRSAAHVASFP